MHHEMGEMIGETGALLARFALDGFARHGDIAQNADHRAKGLDLGEAEDIGRAVLATPLLVELVLLCIVGQDDGELCGALDLGLGLLERFQNSALGQRIKILRPSVVIADNGYLERN